MYIDIEDTIIDAVNEALADGANLVTYDEYCKLENRVAEVEPKLEDLNFWKADRNHSHDEILKRLDRLEDAIFNAHKRVENNPRRIT